MVLTTIIYIITILFILLWMYAAIPKLFDLKTFRIILKSQAIPNWLAILLTWLLPLLELTMVGLLAFQETRLMGMYGSLMLMASFTIYVSGIIFEIYDRYPCPCGGLFSMLGWKLHFKLNILLSIIALIGVILVEFSPGY